VAVLVAIALQLVVPTQLAVRPHWALPVLELGLPTGILVADPGRMNRVSTELRVATLVLAGAVSFANAASLVLLAHSLITGHNTDLAEPLLLSGGAIWVTNVIVFGLWYWEFDRGGPAARAQAHRQHPDFLFPQMQLPDMASREWEPEFIDYLYLSFTNATAFSPTDTLPLSRWAKVLMLVQSAVSLVTLALVVARAVNVLR
jgi:uncharacterized membrane protein